MKKNIFKDKGMRTKLFAAITAVGLVLVFGLNLLLTYFGVRNSIFIDMTPEGFYTLSDRMKEECAFIDEELGADEDPETKSKVTITFCTDPDILIASETTRLTYFMSLQLDEMYDNLEVKCTNVTYNPTSVAKYKATSLSTINPTDVIISYGDRYRIVGADNFWVTSDSELWAYNGEYKMATFIKSVTAKERPAAYFITDHGETYYDPDNKEHPGNAETEQLYYLLSDRGLEVKNLKLSEVEEIPEDCVLLIINDPQTDYVAEAPDLGSYGYLSETEKLDRYLVSDHGSIMVAKDYSTELTILEAFLGEWGFTFSDSLVSDDASYVSENKTEIIGNYDTDENSYGHAIYGDFADLTSAPKTVFKNTGYITCSYGDGNTTPEHGTYSITRNYAPFLYSANTAEAHKYDEITGAYTDLERRDEVLHLAAVTSRMELDNYTAEYKYSYILCANSADFFSNEIIGNASYANYDILSAVIENMSRSDEYASIDLGGISFNSSSLGGKQIADTAIYASGDSNVPDDKRTITENGKVWLTVLVMAAPVAICAVGIWLCVKRRFL